MLNALDHLNRATLIILLFVLGVGTLGFSAALTYDLMQGHGLSSGSSLMTQAISMTAFHAHAWLASHAHVALVAGLVVGSLSLILLWVEVRNAIVRPQLVLSRGRLGQVSISLDQIGMLAQHEAESIEGVREVRTVAQAHKGGISVHQMVAAEPERQLPALAESIQERVKTSLEYHLGFPVRGVRVKLQQASLSKALL